MNRSQQQGTRSGRSRFHPSAWRDLPHLQNIFRESRNPSSSITWIEYSEQWQRVLTTKHEQIDFGASDAVDRSYVESWGTPSTRLCTEKLIIIQDVCSNLIRHLVEIHDISPEMFEEHVAGGDWITNEEDDINNNREVSCSLFPSLPLTILKKYRISGATTLPRGILGDWRGIMSRSDGCVRSASTPVGRRLN